jgi:hypothetical protein
MVGKGRWGSNPSPDFHRHLIVALLLARCSRSDYFAHTERAPGPTGAYMRPYFGFASAIIVATSLSVTFGRPFFAPLGGAAHLNQNSID